MNKRKDKGRLAPFVPLDVEVMSSPAWRATSFGARWLYVHLKRRWSFKQRNNGRLFLSQRDALKEMGVKDRDSISRWFRELQHYGFIVMTDSGGLGVDGKGKAPHWRLTELEAPGGRNGDTWMLPTKDYNKWDGAKFKHDGRQNNRFPKTESRPGKSGQGGRENPARPGRENPATLPGPWPGKSGHRKAPPGRENPAISRSTTWVVRGRGDTEEGNGDAAAARPDCDPGREWVGCSRPERYRLD
jgi:hypothetical protein